MKLWDSGYNFRVEPTGMAEALDLVLKKTVSQEDHKGLDTCGRLSFYFYYYLRDTEEGAGFWVGGG